MSNEPRPRQAVVTGSSSGIGRAIAQALLDGGWHVTGLDVAPTTLRQPGFTPLAVDLADGPALERAAAGLQGADALVHAAGVLRVGPLGRLDAAAGALMWQLHVDAATRLANALVPAMADRGRGRVVFIGSFAGLGEQQGDPRQDRHGRDGADQENGMPAIDRHDLPCGEGPDHATERNGRPEHGHGASPALWGSELADQADEIGAGATEAETGDHPTEQQGRQRA